MNIIKQKLASWKIRKAYSENKRKVSVCNLSAAKKIGVLFDATVPVSFEIVKDFVKELGKTTGEIEVLGFVNSKGVIDHYLYRKGFDFFSRNDLSFTGIPKSETVQQFIQKPFDILISLYLKKNPALDYIASSSLAGFKVGKQFRTDFIIPDLLIDTSLEIRQLKELKEEVKKNGKKAHQSAEFENYIEQKTTDEIELRSLINEASHYLSQLKNKS